MSNNSKLRRGSAMPNAGIETAMAQGTQIADFTNFPNFSVIHRSQQLEEPAYSPIVPAKRRRKTKVTAIGKILRLYKHKEGYFPESEGCRAQRHNLQQSTSLPLPEYSLSEVREPGFKTPQLKRSRAHPIRQRAIEETDISNTCSQATLTFHSNSVDNIKDLDKMASTNTLPRRNKSLQDGKRGGIISSNPIDTGDNITVQGARTFGEQTLNNTELEFLRAAADGDMGSLQNLMRERSFYLVHIDVNCLDSLDRNALSLAVLNRHLDIIKYLLNEAAMVQGHALYYAIQAEFYDAIVALLEHDPQTSLQILPGTTSPFEPGLTPLMLAAHKNNYKILSILYKFNHRLIDISPKIILDVGFDPYSWDAVMERLLHYRALASPAFMLLMFKELGMKHDPFENAMELFGELRRLAKKEREVDETYLQMADQCEVFALQLLQEVRSASELADLMRYHLDEDMTVQVNENRTSWGNRKKTYLRPIEIAIKHKMKDFVTSDNAQLALIYIQKGSVFRRLKGLKATFLLLLIAIFYPLCGLLYIFMPNSTVGRLMQNPSVKFGCSIMSEIYFVVMLLTNTIVNQYQAVNLEEIPVLLIIAYTWILGKFVQEVHELKHQGLMEYIRDIWNWNDMCTIMLFSGYMLFRIIYRTTRTHTRPDAWTHDNNPFHLITLSDICISCAYILIHLRILELLRVDRRFGPLQVSLDLMARDGMRFFLIFLIFFIAFGSGITELYTPYGSNKGCYCSLANCSISALNITGGSSPCTPCKDSTGALSMSLTTFEGTLNAMFWTLFGYGNNPSHWTDVNGCSDQHKLAELVGAAIIMLYHILFIIILVNMLIAMMSNSFQKTHDDSEREWKFHRTQLWLKFIRSEFNSPPPMNLLPPPHFIARVMKKLFNHCCRRRRIPSTDSNNGDFPMRDTGQISNCSNNNTAEPVVIDGDTRYAAALRLVVKRYLKKKVLLNEMAI